MCIGELSGSLYFELLHFLGEIGCIVYRVIICRGGEVGVAKNGHKNLSIDESDFSVQRQGCRIHLTTTEYQLFITLLDHSGCICSRNFLLASAWNITVPIQTRTVDVHIAKLRKKLDLGPDDLKTVMGRGYALSV